jgi:GNAT superfamily N-acetyltransferase
VSTPPLSGQAWTVTRVPVDSVEAADLLRLYFTEIVGRYFNRRATSAEADAAIGEDPNDDLVPPSGLFLLARLYSNPAGCVGLRLLAPDVIEIKRMYVRPEARGFGGGGQLLAAAEHAGRELGAIAVRLDTRHDLVEARRLYAKHGYVEIPPYSDNPYADHWFEKRLV